MNTPIPEAEKPSKDNDKCFDRMLSEEDMMKISAERPSDIFTADNGKVAFNGKIYKDREELELYLEAFMLYLKFRRFFSFKWLWKRKGKRTS